MGRGGRIDLGARYIHITGDGVVDYYYTRATNTTWRLVGVGGVGVGYGSQYNTY